MGAGKGDFYGAPVLLRPLCTVGVLCLQSSPLACTFVMCSYKVFLGFVVVSSRIVLYWLHLSNMIKGYMRAFQFSRTFCHRAGKYGKQESARHFAVLRGRVFNGERGYNSVF